MSTAKKSFWSSLPGLLTALAGILTGVVGLGTLLVSLGVVGGSSNSPTTTVASAGTSGATNGSGAGTSGGGTPTTGTTDGSFTVDPSALTFSLGKTKAAVAVLNTGSVPLKLDTEVSGSDKEKFTVSATACTAGALQPKKSCSIDVSFAGGLNLTATMTVSADKATDRPVTLSGSL